VATASVIQILESMLPHPIPGLRFGLANMISLIVLIQYGFRPALTITLLRTVVSSFVMGTFLSPGFILSFAGGLAGILVSGLLLLFSSRFRLFRISPIGLSIAGAFAHNMVQLCLAYLLLIRHPGIFFLVPWLSFGSVLLGAFSGWIATAILKQLDSGKAFDPVMDQKGPAYQNRIYQTGTSLLHRCRPDVKFSVIFFVTLLTVWVENLVLYSLLFAGIMILIPVARLSYPDTLGVIKKLSVIIFSAFLLPVYFNVGSRVLVETGLFVLHQEAVITGCVFAFRIIILALFSSILAQTTRTEDFTRGISTFIRPLDRFGMNSSAVARNISISIASLPDVWHDLGALVTSRLKGKKRSIQTLKTVVIELFVYIFSTKNAGK
jgi:heptaprenyl diphosphate synthase